MRSAELEQQLQNLADNLPNGMIYQMEARGNDRRVLYVSKGVERIFGLSQDEVLADAGKLYAQVAPEFLETLEQAEDAALLFKTAMHTEFMIQRVDGSAAWVEVTSVPRATEDGRLIWDGSVIDITARKQAEAAQKASERRLEIALSAAALGIWEWSPQGNAVSLSPRAREIFGLALEGALTGEEVAARVHPDDLQLVTDTAQKALNPAIRGSYSYQYRIMRPETGEIRWVLAHGEGLFAEIGGETVGLAYIGTMQDITEQKAADDALAESEARLRLAVEAGQMAVWEVDMATGVITHSPELNRLYGFPEDARPTLDDYRSRYAPGEAERMRQLGEDLRARGETMLETEVRHILPDGTEKWLFVRAQSAPGAGGDGSRVIGVVFDVTQRKRTEERLALVTQELRHRVKNSIAVSQSIARQTFTSNRPHAEAHRTFEGRMGAIAAATDSVMAEEWTQTSLAELVKRILQPFAPDGSGAFVTEGADLPIAGVVATAIGMALHELCTNAVKYGALSSPRGQVDLRWEQAGDRLHMVWVETGGPSVTAPEKKGFGTNLLERGLFSALDGSVDLQFRPTGVTCAIDVPLMPDPAA